MPDNFNWNQFGAGWIPSDDAVNGRKNGFLKGDNLELDQNGALTLGGGTSVEGSAYSHNAHTLYSNIIGGSRKDYLADTNGGIFRNGSSIGTGGDASNAAFGAAYNFTLVASGNERLKDSGSATVNLGVSPNVEGIAAIAVDGQYYNLTPVESSTAQSNTGVDPTLTSGPLIGEWALEPLNNFSGGYSAWGQTITTTTTTVDLTAFSSVGQIGGDPSSPLPGAPNYSLVNSQDVTYMDISATGGFGYIASITLDFILETGDSSGDVAADYFTQTWQNDGSQSGPSGQIPFIRGDGISTGFLRVGPGIQGWSAVKGFRITVTWQTNTPFSNAAFIVVPTFFFYGAAHTLNGTYQFVQVNVNNTGSYEAKSVLGTPSGSLTFNNQLARIIPYTPTSDDAQCNEAWIYAIGGTLDQWYRIILFNSTTGFTTPTWTAMSDIDLIELDLVVNLNLVSIASSGISAKIFDIIGPIEGRWFYFTGNTMYPSDINDPDLVDVSLGVTTSNSSAEIYLWARRAAANQVWVGTSRDIYILAGTFETLPDGSIDVFFQSLSCQFPPISYDASASGSAVFYLAADGWRTMDGVGNCTALTPTNTDRLYRGITCYGYSVDVQVIAGSTRFPCVLARNKFWCSITGQSRMEVLDPTRSYWRNFAIGKGDCLAICSTQDGNILGFFASDKKLRILDVQASLEIDGSTKQTVNLLSPVFDGGTPKQRHEFYTIKARLATGSTENLAISLLHENGTTYSIGNMTSTGAISEQVLDVTQANVPLGRYWQFVATGTFSQFTLDDISIDFDTRPVQLTHLHLLPTDFDHPGRKRIPSVPFLIDTLGNDVTFTPIVDGSSQTAKTVSSSRITSFDYQFTADVPGRDWEFVIDGGGDLFEFIRLGTPDYIEKFPEPKTFYILPVTNFGTSARKRIRTRKFVLDPLTGTVTFTPIIDGSSLSTTTFTTAGKRTLPCYFTADEIGIDWSGTLSGTASFELWEVIQPGEGDIEVFPDYVRYYKIPKTNFDSPNKKRIRVWPFVINTGGNNVTFTPTADDSAGVTVTFNTSDFDTVRYYFKTDIFGVFYDGVFSGAFPFEVREILQPDIVQVLPIARQFDQVGPEELFRYGRIKQIELRVLAFGTTIPYAMYFNDNSVSSGEIAVPNGDETTVAVGLPMGNSGSIVRVVFGPTSFDFHRFYLRVQVMKSGRDTDLEWVTIPDPQAGE